ncbi:MAG: glucose-1-phosphate adenylyltransferase subunit GlgD [Clostridiaceae bacterium]
MAKMDYMGILSLTESEIDIRNLTLNRPLASIPIGGRYRIVDFVLSNMINAGITNVGVFAQSDSRSLIDHLGTGKPWGLDRNVDGLFIYQYSYERRMGGDVKMINNNMKYFSRSKQKNVILASSSIICKIDYQEAIKNHEASGKDITIVYKKMKNADKEMLNAKVLYLNSDSLVTGTGDNFGGESEANISLEIFLMKKEKLTEFIKRSMQRGTAEESREIIYRYASANEVNAYEYKGFMKRIDSIMSYYDTNMEMLNPDVLNQLFYENGRIYTKIKNDPPSKYSHHAEVENSLISNGCIIDGKIKNSILSRQVRVKKGALIENSIILQGCEIEENTVLVNVILDKGVIVRSGAALRGSPQFPVVIEKNSVINP